MAMGGYSLDLPPPPRMLARHHQNDSEVLVGEPAKKSSFPSGMLGRGVDRRYSWHKKKHT